MNSHLSKNNLNLALAAGAILFVAGCFWSRGPVSDSEEPSANVEAPAIEYETPGSRPSDTAQGKRKDEGDFIVQHLEVATPRYREIDRQVKDAKLLEDAADKLNHALSLPRDIYLRTKDCNEVNAFYNAADRSVTMCYELMEHFYRIFRSTGITDDKAYSKMNDAVRFVFLHEIGHALIDQYKLPVAGNEEDAADRCSAYINLKELGEDGVRAVFAAAEAFSIESKRSPNNRNLADEHLLSEQRFYNSLCMIYGSNPEKHAKIVDEGFLPKERAVRCRGEYQRAVDSWVSLLEPWRKN
ncbi:MAG TPA: DUF4344 domain-containing metallopeptidase [Pyrinomonadaceae bacterium]|nr:DUF4344 domain-containing metallopeptidase [Pyrinomonadaceae bacterium]